MKTFAVSATAAVAIPILMLLLLVPNVYASIDRVQGEKYGPDPDRPSEQSNYEGDLYCYENGERDGVSRTFNRDSFEDCQMNDGDNPYNDGFEYGCERDNTRQDISVINTDTGMNPNEVIATISDITHAWGLAYDPANEEMYVSEFLSTWVPGSNVRIIDTNTNALVGDPSPVGNLPEGIAYEPVHRRMYVANFGSDSISVIQTS